MASGRVKFQTRVCLILNFMLFAPVIIKLQLPSESPGKLVKTQIADSTSRVFQSVNLGWGPWICICNQFPGTSNAAGPEITLWKPLPYALVPPQIGSMELTWEPAATAGSQAPVTQNLPATRSPGTPITLLVTDIAINSVVAMNMVCHASIEG